MPRFGRLAAWLSGAACWLALAPAAHAAPYLVVRDPANIAKNDQTPNISAWRTQVLDEYEAAGLPVPEVLSVWTAFPMAGNDYATYIDPRENDVTGIGLDSFYPPDGLFASTTPPLRAVLWHNNVHALPDRADLHRAPLDGYAGYLFLLELSHLWGPALRVPAPGDQDLIGFPYHWSFFLDQPGPAGGNMWDNNGDGTFTVVPGDPATVRFSMLDLYAMGLADASEVDPFGVLINTSVPATPTDPFWGGAYEPHSFPWFDAEGEPLTITAERREITIDDVIAANGPRVPGSGEKTSWTIGFVLLVEAEATDQDISAAESAFAPIAESLPEVFALATQGRGELEVVSQVEEPGGGGAGGGEPQGGNGGAVSAGGAGAAGGGPLEDGDSGGCDCSSAPTKASVEGWGWLALLAALSRSCSARRSCSGTRRR